MWSGIVLVGAMTILVLTGIMWKWLTYLFETFLRLHWLLFIIVFIFSALHGVGSVLTVALPIFVLDLILRLAFSLYYRRKLKEVDVDVVPDLNVVKLSFKKKQMGFNYKAGQYAFLTVPSVTFFENHPFSIESSPQEDEVRFYSRALGDWTTELLKQA